MALHRMLRGRGKGDLRRGILGPTTNHRVNHEPLELRLYFGANLAADKWLCVMSSRFDLMGLTFVYDDDPACKRIDSYRIQQEESRSPCRFTEKRV